MSDALEEHDGKVSIGGRNITNLRFADDIDALAEEGWSGGAMVLGKLPVPGRPTIWITIGQGPTALAVGAGRGCLDIFTLIYPFFPLSPSLWETARYRLKYCLKGPLNPKQPTNLAEEEHELEAPVESLDKTCTRYKLEISDDKQRQWHPERNKGKRAEVGHCNKLQVPWSSCYR